MNDSPADLAILALAVVFVGISKAGFGGGTGVLATPLIATVMDPGRAVGILLPLLLVSDAVAVWHYRRDVVWRSLARAWPGTVAGVGLGALAFAAIKPNEIKAVIGGICLAFCCLQWFRHWILKKEEGWRPGWIGGTLLGTAAGVSSTLAHAAGPVMAMYLLPQQLSPAHYMGTNTVYFGVLNTLKLVPYLAQGIINAGTLAQSLLMSPAVIAGTLLGIWMNSRFHAAGFARVLYVLLFLTGLELMGVRRALMP